MARRGRAPRSLCYRTDLFLASIDGVVRDVARPDGGGRYFVVETPTNKSFWWGNFLIFEDPPRARDLERGHDGSWLDTFERELPGRPCTLIAWDRPDGELGDAKALVPEGFKLDESAILTATRVAKTPRHNDDVRVEPIFDEAGWQAAARVLVNAFSPRRSGSLAELEDFVERQLRRYRMIQDRKIGQWYGAWLGDRMAATLGLIRVDGYTTEPIGRFQLVGTDPAFGRQGVCSSLVYEVARRGLEEQGLTSLVMAADAEYHAAKVYESVGFERTETLLALMRHASRG